MDKKELDTYIGSADMYLVEAIKKIDANSKGLLYITDGTGKLAGCLTDGDVRRWIIKTGNLNVRASDAMNHKPKYIYNSERGNSNKIMEEQQIYSVAVVDSELKVTDIIFHEFYLKTGRKAGSKALNHVPVIVMAGGKGTRLYPYTKILPKPLIPIGEIPILERIFERFHLFGADEFYLTVNYKKEMIKSYFWDLNPSYRIHFIEESVPLGTAGSIRLIGREFEVPVIITNCDILVRTDYEKMMDYHRMSGNDMTIVSSLKNIPIPYGVLHTKEQGIILSMEEKPRISYFINTGMYIVNPEFLKWIPEGKVFHMTDLADKMINGRKKVGMYPISENSFLDMGEFEEMKRMEENMDGDLYG